MTPKGVILSGEPCIIKLSTILSQFCAYFVPKSTWQKSNSPPCMREYDGGMSSAMQNMWQWQEVKMERAATVIRRSSAFLEIQQK